MTVRLFSRSTTLRDAAWVAEAKTRVLQKPFSREQLLDVLSATMDRAGAPERAGTPKVVR